MKFAFLLLVSLSAFGQTTPYVAEGLMAADGNPPFCVSDINSSMSDRSYDNRGAAGASYSCSMGYTFHARDQYNGFNSEAQGGQRSISYHALPTRTRSDRHMRGRTGVVTGPSGFVIYGLSGHGMRTMYATAEQLSEVFTVEIKGRELHLTALSLPANAQQEISCLVIGLELLNAACDGFQDEIRVSIMDKIRRIRSDARLRELIVPLR